MLLKRKSQISENYNKVINQQEMLNFFNIEVNKQLKERNSSSETTRIISFNEWLGGLMDADGCFYFSKKGYLSCEITLSKREVIALYKIKAIYGGSIIFREKLNCYRWRLHKKELLKNFLNALNGNIRVKIVSYKKAINIYLPHLDLIYKKFEDSGAWFSGFMEGDGSFIISGKFSIFLQVSHKNEDILHDISLYFGGNIYFDKSWNGYTWRIFNKFDLFILFLYFTHYPLLSLKNSDIVTLKRLYRWKLMGYHLQSDKQKQLMHYITLFKKRKKI